jgi:hypothetical protein
VALGCGFFGAPSELELAGSQKPESTCLNRLTV